MFPDPNRRRILALDGGGVRGIITLQALHAMEGILGRTCFQAFDGFAGTSTGAIIAAALAAGRSVQELIDLYRDRREEVFSRTLLSYLLGRLVTRYRKGPIHEILRDFFGDVTLEGLPKDIFITSTDTVRSETTYFTAFTQPNGSREGFYREIPVRHAVEASLSAPTYFSPHGRFIDGGVGVHNNPAYVSAVEALRFSGPPAEGGPRVGVYAKGKLDVVSFGTGAQPQLMEPGQAGRTSVFGWLGYVIGEGMDQASVQQSYIAWNELHGEEKAIRFYRYQLYLSDAQPSREFVSKTLGLWVPPDFEMDRLTLDATDEERFDFLDAVGAAWGAYLAKNGFFFRQDGVWREDGQLGPAPQSYVREIAEELATADE
jgi:hypothetical protein